MIVKVWRDKRDKNYNLVVNAFFTCAEPSSRDPAETKDTRHWFQFTTEIFGWRQFKTDLINEASVIN